LYKETKIKLIFITVRQRSLPGGRKMVKKLIYRVTMPDGFGFQLSQDDILVFHENRLILRLQKHTLSPGRWSCGLYQYYGI